MKVNAGSGPRRGTGWIFALGLVLLTVIVYIPAVRGGFVWDDDDYLLNNQSLDDLRGLGRIWTDLSASPQYYPLTFTSFWVERRLWGLRPEGFHLVNILLHAANALLLWRILARLSVPGGWLAAAIFALHPIQVESVAWITERKNTLSGLMYLLALLSWLRFAGIAADQPGPAPERARRRTWRWYAAALCFFALALFSKTVTASLPVAVLLILWWKRGLARRDLLLVSPLLLLGAAAGALTSWLEKATVGAVGADWSFSFIERVLIAGRALWFYTGKLLWPWPLMFVYPRWRIDAGSLRQYLFPLAAAAVILALWLLRHRLGRGPAAAVLFFTVTLFPALGFINLYPMRYSFVADHFQYLAGAGLTVLLAALVGRVSAAAGPGRRSAACAVLALPILLPLGVLSRNQAAMYRDIETLWRSTLAQNPGAWIAHNNLGTLHHNRGEDRQAAACFAETVRLKPDYETGWHNWGTSLVRLGSYAEAELKLRAALRLSPGYADAWSNLGIALHFQGRAGEALAALSRARILKPGSHLVHYNLGVVYENSGRTPEAIESFRRSLALKPDFDPARRKLGKLVPGQSSSGGAGVRGIALSPRGLSAEGG